MKVLLSKVVSSTMIVAMIIAVLIGIPLNVSAANSYNPSLALEYAREHWNDGVGLCAEFVSNCLKAGGCTAWSAGCTTLVRRLNEGGWGQLNSLVSSNGSISSYDNPGKIQPGDLIFCYCNSCDDGLPYVHVYLYSGNDANGYYAGYAHHRAWGGTKIIYQKCGYCDGSISFYAYNFYNSHEHNYISSISSTHPHETLLVCSCGDTKNTGSYNEKLDCLECITYSFNLISPSNTIKYYNGHKYTLYTGNISWQMAQLYCEKAGGSLVTIADKNEQDIIKTMMPASAMLWIGGTDVHSEGNWKWVTGENITFSNWADGEPNNTSETEHYACISSANYKWNDVSMTNQAITGFLMETSAEIVTVTFNGNGSTVSPSTKKVTVGMTYGELPIPIRNGYKFLGWGANKDSTTYYSEKSTVKNIANHTLYAVWKVDTTIVTFDPNGGDVTIKSKEVIAGENYGELPIPSRDGYRFLGWGANKDSTTYYSEKSTVKNATNHTLYAIWELDTTTVTFNPNGGEITIKSKEVIFGENYGELPIPIRNGYIFLGWGANRDSTTFYTSITNVKNRSDHTLYAIYRKDIGNLNSDDKITIDDSLLLQKYFSGSPLTINKTQADIDGSGTVTRKDAMILARYLAGWPDYVDYFD